MTLQAKKDKIVWCFIFFTLSATVVKEISPYLIYFITIAFFLYYVIKRDKLCIPKIAPLKYLSIIFIFGMCIGLKYVEENGVVNYLKDFISYSAPIMYIIIGYMMANKNKEGNIYKTIHIISFFSAIINLFVIIINFKDIVAASNINSVRAEIKYYNIHLIVMSIIILLTKREIIVNKVIDVGFLMLMILQVLLTFSRSYIVIMILSAIPFIVSTLRKISIKSLLRVMFVLLVVFVIINIAPDTLIKSFVNKFERTFVEIGVNSNWYNYSNIVQNWRGYETYRAISIYKSGKFLQKIFGYGFGKLISVGKYSELVGVSATAAGIPVLHNGYSQTLVKGGIVGVILYIMFYIDVIRISIKKIKYNINVYNFKLILGIALMYLVTSYTTRGIIAESSSFALCVLLGYLWNNANNLKEVKNEN